MLVPGVRRVGAVTELPADEDDGQAGGGPLEDLQQPGLTVKEEGSAEVDRLFARQAGRLCTGSLSYAEVYATLHRLRREGLLRAGDLTRLVAAFESDWRVMAVVELGAEVRRGVPGRVAAAGLRGADLVHLACALAMKARVAELELWTADRRLMVAALDLGLAAVDPTAG